MLFHTRFRALIVPLTLFAAMSACAKKKHAAAAHTVSTPRPSAPAATNPLAPETGIASWYGHPYHGRPAADGEIYDMEKMTAAHRTLPFGTWVRVVNLTNGKSVDVRIIDRGPFIDGRIIDLSHAAARDIDLIGPGIAQVRLEIITAPPLAQELYSVQIGAYRDRDKAERMRIMMEDQFGWAKVVLRSGSVNVWRVLAGEATNLDDANMLAERVRAQTGQALVVRIDPNAQANPTALRSTPQTR